MIIKRFAVTLIIMATVLYGSIFVMSKQYGTPFFEEIVIQLNRMNEKFGGSPEVTMTKTVLKAIIENETPPDEWNRFILHASEYSPNDLFYLYKVWSVTVSLTLRDINKSYPILNTENENGILLRMRYGKTQPVLQFKFFKVGEDTLAMGLFYPVNEPPVSADLNNDKTIDAKDVRIARRLNRS